MQNALEDKLREEWGTRTTLDTLELLAGGTSQETWGAIASVGEKTLDLAVRRGDEEGGNLFPALGLCNQFRLMEQAFGSGVSVPEPYLYMPDLAGEPAIVMQYVKGETLGRRIVRKEEYHGARDVLPTQMAREASRIHATTCDDLLAFLPHPPEGVSPGLFEIQRLQEVLDTIGEPHPALELGLLWLKENAPPAPDNLALIHGDFRVGNFIVDEGGLAGVLDWELAHVGDPAEDLGWACVREWRFGTDELRVGGIGSLESFLEEYEYAGRHPVSAEEIFYWEVLGNLRWAILTLTQARRHLSGHQRSIDLASLGRKCAEVELELLSLTEMGNC